MNDVVALGQYRKPQTQSRMGNQRGIVREFTQALNLCSLCGSHSHRASKCPLRPASEQPREI